MRKFEALPDGESIFSVTASGMKFGRGALKELGEDAKRFGIGRAVLFIDHHVRHEQAAETAIQSLKAAGVDHAVYGEIQVEPTDQSIMQAAEFARDGKFDGIISLGGGSVIDTAKGANLFAAHGGEILDYVNAPIGEGRAVPGPVMPHIACPTTSGTGSEMTGTVVMDLVGKGLKSGISHVYLKPTLALADPIASYTAPSGVVAACGFDVFTHAIESLTARPFTSREAPATPNARPVYQGANPWSDMGAMQAVVLGGGISGARGDRS